MLALAIDDDFRARGIAVSLGCIQCGLEVATASAELAAALHGAAAARIAERGSAPASEVGRIAAARRAYRALGKDPARYRPAAEALIRRLCQGKGMVRVNNVVDVNNLFSIRTGISIDAYDGGAIVPPVTFRRAGPGETFEGIGRGPLNLEGLPVFADARGPFGSPTSDSERTKTGPGTKTLLMILIAFEDESEMPALLAGMAELLEAHCRASDMKTRILANCV